MITRKNSKKKKEWINQSNQETDKQIDRTVPVSYGGDGGNNNNKKE